MDFEILLDDFFCNLNPDTKLQDIDRKRVLSVVNSFEEGIERANDSRFGLQVGVYTNSIESMKYAFNQCETGAVIMNFVPGFRIDNMPYGGVKQSGFGREGIKYAMKDFSEEKLLIY